MTYIGKMRADTLIVPFVCAAFLVGSLRAQIPSADLQRVSGAWECVDSDGIHGILITSSTHTTGTGDEERVDWQGISIFVYQRDGGKEEGGYFTAGHHGPDGGADLDGKRLLVYLHRPLSNISNFDADLIFDDFAGQWEGHWSFCNSPGRAVLARPYPREGNSPSVFSGDWDASSASGLSGALHIRQGFDGKMLSWLERIEIGVNRPSVITSAGSDASIGRITTYTNSQQLNVVSATKDKIFLKTISGVGPTYVYEATLSADGNTITGAWHNESAEEFKSRSLNAATMAAPTVFRRRN